MDTICGLPGSGNFAVAILGSGINCTDRKRQRSPANRVTLEEKLSMHSDTQVIGRDIRHF